MDTTARYSALEHGGLEVTERPDGPEVVPGTLAPVVERRSSLNSPEIVHPEQYQTNKQEHGNYFGGNDEAAAPEYGDEARPAYISNDAKEPGVGTHETGSPRKSRRYCGMSRAVFIAVIVVAAVVVLGAVLGGVLGTLLTRRSVKSSDSSLPQPYSFNGTSNTTSKSNGPLEAMAGTGFATAVSADGSGRLLMYYQDANGRIIENSYLNESWTLEDSSLIDQSMVTNDATRGSPLAAVSYTLNGLQYRQVFYIDGTGLVKTTNSTTVNDTNAIATSWTTPYAITNDPASTSGTAGLAACSDHVGMNGIRVYYGSGSGYVQEVAYQFNNTAYGWNGMNSFASSDPNSGVACVVFDNTVQEDQYVNVYMRNTSGIVVQNYFDFLGTAGWNIGPETSMNLTIASGSAIAACNDDSQSEYVHFQLTNGTIVRALVDPSGSMFEQYNNLQSATSNSKMAAAYVDGGALLMFQNDSSDSTMWAADTSRTMVSILNEAIP
ncbi:hypothetical protein B0A55_03181 [Friedmanniomyces simplex]|uniref:Uncharacterized protein n=1 Tax=Friedmanniomyces simplex TaxID=329884 RepID=A0A4U0XFL7_9PEZI|nr:hypothetical protein B0A55_03181 [Friedmanniomyces simplex]